MARPAEARPEKMPRNTAVFVAVVLLVVGTVGGLELGSTAAQGSGSALSPCSDSIILRTYYDQSNKTLTTTALLMAPGSTAEVCITYSIEGAVPVSHSTGPLACGPSRSANESEACSGQLTVAASAVLPNYSSGSSGTIAYELRASKNAAGAFWFWVDCGESFPIAVGAPPSSLTFPIIPGCVYEPNAPGRASVTGISNMSSTTVRVD